MRLRPCLSSLSRLGSRQPLCFWPAAAFPRTRTELTSLYDDVDVVIGDRPHPNPPDDTLICQPEVWTLGKGLESLIVYGGHELE